MRFRLAIISTALCPLALLPWRADAQELPSGSSAAFREKMMAWAVPQAVPSSPVAVAHSAGDAPVGGAAVRLPRLSSAFGYRDHPILGQRLLHAGIDIPGPLGTPIRASGSGVVSFSGRAGGYGEMIEIDHGNGMRTRYAHLSRLLVAPGTPVRQGQEIALMGSTGRSTGSHLHFEVRVNGRAANPLGYLGTPPAPSGASVLSPGTLWSGSAEPYLSAYAKARREASHGREEE